MIVYMAVELDEYELPYAVADTVRELAEMLGVTRNAVSVGMAQAKKLGCRSRYMKVEIPDE